MAFVNEPLTNFSGKLKIQPAHSKTQKGKKNETDRCSIEGKCKKKVESRGGSAEGKTIPGGAEILAICLQAFETVHDLIRLAPKSDELPLPGNAAKAVAGMLWIIACDTVEALDAIAKKHPECLLELSRKMFFWPSFISRKRAFKLENTKLMKKLQLGDGGIYSKRQWRVSAPSTRAAFALFVFAQQKGCDLPPLTKKSKKTWFEAGWNYMLGEVRIVPEESPLLAPLGKSAIGKKSISRGMSQQTEGMKRDDMRAEIKRQLWRAFDKLIAGAEK